MFNKLNIEDNLTSLENILIPEDFEEQGSQIKDGTINPQESRDITRLISPV